MLGKHKWITIRIHSCISLPTRSRFKGRLGITSMMDRQIDKFFIESGTTLLDILPITPVKVL